jgi:hypothetical protein
MEREMLALLDYNVYVSNESYDEFCSFVLSEYGQSLGKPRKEKEKEVTDNSFVESIVEIDTKNKVDFCEKNKIYIPNIYDDVRKPLRESDSDNELLKKLSKLSSQEQNSNVCKLIDLI